MLIEETELRDAARQLLTGMADASADDLWSTVVESGWPALTAPEGVGGLDQPFAAAAWLYLEIGHAVSSAPLLTSLLGVDALKACPASARRDELLEAIVGGEKIACALTEGQQGLTTATDGQLSGTLRGVAATEGAANILIVNTDPALIAVVPLDAAGITVTPVRLWDETRSLAEAQFDNVVLEDDWIIASGDDAAAAAAAYSTHLHYAIAADCVGAGHRILDETIEFLKTRRQFDRPLALFQALKHRCADLRTSLSAAEALLADRLAGLTEFTAAAVPVARGTKGFASAVFHDVTEEAMQLHGGISMSVEHHCHAFLKRALLNEHLASADDACDLANGDALLRQLANGA